MRQKWLSILFPIVISLIFFYPILSGKIPFPGDLVVGHYQPYASYPYAGYNPGSFPNKGQDFDVLTLIYPDKEFSIQSLLHGAIPLWNPYIFSGNPHLATMQSGTFYLFNLIFFVLPFTSAWTIYILIEPILACYFTYLFLKALKFSEKSSMFGGIVFAFSSYSVVWMEYGNLGHAIVWLPLALLLILKIIEERRVLYGVLLSMVLAMSILAGYIQLSIYVFGFTFLFFVFNAVFIKRKDWLGEILRIIPYFIFPFFLSAIQLFPSIELFTNSARSSYTTSEFYKTLIPSYHIVTLFVQDFFGNPATKNYWLDGTYIERVSYIGVVPLIFVIYSFFGKRGKLFWFFVVGAVGAILLSFDTFISRFIFSFNIPIISTTIPTRIMFIFTFSASILAAFGFESFFAESNGKKIIKTLFGLSFIYLLIWGFTLLAPHFLNTSWVANLAISKRNIIFPTLILFLASVSLIVSLKIKTVKPYIFYLLLIITVVDLFYFFHKITPFSTKDTIYPTTQVMNELRNIQGIDRSWGYGGGYIDANIPLHEKTYSTDGYNALYIKMYGSLIASSKTGVVPSYIPRSNARIVGGYGAQDLRSNSFRQRILDLLGVKYILNRTDVDSANPDYLTFPQSVYSLVWNSGPWQIYQNRDAVPRIFLASNYIVEKQDVIGRIFDRNVDLSKTVILEQILGSDINPASGESMLKIVSYEPNKIIVNTDSNVDKLLFVSDNYFPGWKVKIDGKESNIYKADYTFRAVSVKAGKHEIIMYYAPSSFFWGRLITGISILCLLLFGVFVTITKKHGNN